MVTVNPTKPLANSEQWRNQVMPASSPDFNRPLKHLTHLDEWRRMGEANIFPPDSRVELINGEILDMAPIGSYHAGHLKRINHVLSKLIPENLITSVQDPLQLGDLSEPEPDFMLLKAHEDFYTSRHPVAADVLLLIEVADSSLRFDQNEKLRLYALHGVPEYWLLNLNGNCLEVYRKPNGDGYAEKTTLQSGDSITLSQLPDLSIEVAEIL
ncbi:MAG: Uma2 family endonuclease [Methylovulum sp.]|uniref:Uma2 family endonuclease n=1 Tax=Methylovulum sp. TaxID=1916980 RepID=UPI0026141C6B|nr:Uma2 family endonuclease [Methylovulum sp.]MDD2723707.1 Uma2 family endonuclease [Methylovulum sp.]MDD5123319.1 Uma2 family endonuclease [Methylovulum sp.]